MKRDHAATAFALSWGGLIGIIAYRGVGWWGLLALVIGSWLPALFPKRCGIE